MPHFKHLVCELLASALSICFSLLTFDNLLRGLQAAVLIATLYSLFLSIRWKKKHQE